MGIFRRTPTQIEPDFHTAGMEAAVGIVPDRTAPPDRTEAPLGIECGTCGAAGRIDMIDMTVRRAYLTCRRCGRTWDTDRTALPAQPFFSRSK